MKKLLIFLTIASVFGACKSDSDAGLKTNEIIPVTSGTYGANSSGDTSTALQKGERPVVVSKSSENRGDGSKASATSDNSTTAAGNANTSTATTKKKGWSAKAKGAVIGGAAGAVGGALISKHKGTGAVVGGLAGAAGGYIIGNEVDKKNNR